MSARCTCSSDGATVSQRYAYRVRPVGTMSDSLSLGAFWRCSLGGGFCGGSGSGRWISRSRGGENDGASGLKRVEEGRQRARDSEEEGGWRRRGSGVGAEVGVGFV